MTLGLGSPPDAAAWAAVALAGLMVLVGHRAIMPLLLRAPRNTVIAILGACAVALSGCYLVYYLRGGPRIIDATSYWLHGRALSHGVVAWDVPEPTASQRGRFLLLGGTEGARHLSVIFPPGYPAILALGFLLGAPQWVGPALAGVLVVATYALARRVSDREDVARLAASLSVVSATLRYHTADTMSHGWAALLLVACLVFALDSVSKGSLVRAALAGLAFGWLVATRPVTAVAVSPLLLLALVRMRAPARAWMALAASVPIGLFVLQQRWATGHFFWSSQSAYYAVSDGPPGCFRLGFGSGIGCLHEHGDYVRAIMPDGFGMRAAVVNTLRRLWLHLSDIANVEPLALLPILGAWLWRRNQKVVWLTTAVPLVVMSYGFFYFDGSYPGGGGRLFADLLPIEHILAALGVIAVARRAHALPPTERAPLGDQPSAPKPFGRSTGRNDQNDRNGIDQNRIDQNRTDQNRIDQNRIDQNRIDQNRIDHDVGAAAVSRAAAWTLGLALAGFGVRASYLHLQLSEREGGRPYYEPAVLKEAKVDRGLLFTQTDSAFNLAFDPAARDPQRDLVVVRERGDDRDRLAWERLGRPHAFRYIFGGRRDERPAVVSWSPPPFTAPFRYEAEAEWPPLEQVRGYLEPMHATGTCAWGGQVLTARPEPGSSMYGRVSVPVPFPGRFRVGVHVASKGKVLARLALLRAENAPPVATWPYAANHAAFTCATLMIVEADLGERAALEIQVQGEEFSLDAVALEPVNKEDG